MHADRDASPKAFESVVVVDDQPVDARLLASLSTAFGASRVRTAASLEAALDPQQNLSGRDLVLLEPALTGSLGLETLTRLRLLRPQVPVAVRSANSSGATIRAAIGAGIRGYFPKTMAPDLLIAGLQYVAAGGVFVPLEALGAVWEDERPFVPAGRGFTAGQTRVLGLLLTGRSNRQIAQELHISEGTVKQHLHVLYRALQVNSRAEVLAGAARGSIRHHQAPPEES